MKPFGARLLWSALWPRVLAPRDSAVWMTTFGLSTWQALTSQPASIKARADSASRTGSDQSPVMMRWTSALGLTLRAPMVNELTLRSTRPIGLAATKPILLVLVERPAAIPFT